MKTRKTKKRNIIRRAVAFLLCMTMVLGLGMQDVIEQVYAEEASAVSREQSADVPATQEVESTETTTPEGETDPTASEETGPATPEEKPTASEEDKKPAEPTNPTETEGNTEVTTPPTETTDPSAPEEPTTPADGTENTETDESTDLTAPVNPDGSNGSESSGETTTTPGEGTGTDEQKPPVEEETKEESVSELTYAAEDGSFSVKAAAVSEDVDLSGIEIHAAQVQEDGEEYAAAEELVAAALDAESRQIEKLLVYDIWFTYTESGETADLSGQVQISLEYTEPEFPEGIETQTEVFCLNDGAAEAAGGTDALEAGYDLYALAWTVPTENTDTWEWTDDQVIIKASAAKGVLPEEAEISVTPIVKTEEEELANLSEEERAEAENINEQYDSTEEKLREDSEVNGETLEGFLAYDISFYHLENGTEISPSGDVNVTIEFKDSILPEGVSEDASVSVKHLKEDEDAEDGIVVEDMEETSEIQATETAAVEKVSLTAESFSIYTINWVQQRVSFTAETVDMDGESIGNGETKWVYVKTENGYTESAVANSAPDIKNYNFVYAYVNGQKDAYGTINTICYWPYDDYDSETDSPFQVKTTEGTFRLKKDDVVYFVYSKDGERPKEVDTHSENIDISLFNYNGRINSSNLAKKGFGFYTSTAGVDGSSDFEGRFTNSASGAQGVLPDIVKKNLDGGKEGLPVLNTDRGVTMNTLFTGENTTTTDAHMNLSGLFQVDEDGYYYYDSLDNGAVLEGNEIKVYDTPVAANDSNLYYGNFFPFNDDWVDEANRGKLYPIPSRSQIDLWFGMNIGMTFYQPLNGEIEGKDMVFEFSGDDDVWVFIDGVLVLDLGGIHGRKNGTINFSTGVVVADGTEKTLRQCYEEAYKELHPHADQSEINEYLNTIFGGAGRFINYTDHRMEFFYLERGGGAANCRIKFNMPSLPNNGITVSKIIDNYDQGAYTDVEFEFELYIDKNNDGEVEDSEKVTVQDEEYKNYIVKEIGSTGEGDPRTLGDDGIFKLKHNQMAIFEEIGLDVKYKVKEVGVSSAEYDSIEITSGVSDVTGDVDLGDGQENGFAVTKVLTTGTDIQAVFHNSCNPTNMKNLYIYKYVNGQNINPNETYTVLVKIAGQPYNGKYLIGTLGGQGEKGTTTDGRITFNAGEVVTVLGNVHSDDGDITGFPSGTSFEVVEEGLDTTVYIDPTYSVKEGTADNREVGDSAKGEFVLDSNAEVTVINTCKSEPDSSYVEVQKVFEGLTQDKVPSNFNLKVSEYDDTLTLSSGEQVTGAEWPTYSWKLENFQENGVTVSESGEEVNDYTVIATVNNIPMQEGSLENVSLQSAEFEIANFRSFEKPQKQQELEFEPDIIIGQVNSVTAGTASYLVWTKKSLSSGDRAAIIAALESESIDNVNIANTVFFSTKEVLQEGINYVGALSVEEKENAFLLNLTTPDKWECLHYANYERTNEVNAEIEVVNSYVSKEVVIDLQKYGTQVAGAQLQGARFTLYPGITDAQGNLQSWSEEPVENYLNFGVSEENLQELKLKSGYYMLKEELAPSEYQKLVEAICFKVEGTTVKLVKENGEAYGSGDEPPTMWEIDTSNGIVLKIKNDTLYALPEAGGPGIHLYMLGGTLLMMAGALLVYKKRKEEVLRS